MYLIVVGALMFMVIMDILVTIDFYDNNTITSDNLEFGYAIIAAIKCLIITVSLWIGLYTFNTFSKQPYNAKNKLARTQSSLL